MIIDQFTGEYRFLSNFAEVAGGINFDGLTYPTVEHAYQAAKTLDPDQRGYIQMLVSPGAAKRSGKCIQLRSDWETVKFPIMLSLLRLKFAREPFCTKLLATGGAELIEGNTWHDTIWGVCNGVGQNHLGRMLMQVRRELRGESIMREVVAR